MLKGIDISSYQSSINISALETTDFVIVKATQGLTYVNPCYGRHANDTLKAGKLLGVYHYAGGNGAAAEADFFWSRFKPYAGKAIPVLDWEGYQNSRFSQGPAWVKPFVERFHALSGVWPLIYMSKSVCRSYNWSWVAERCGLWCAQYASNSRTDYQSKPWTDSKGCGAWKQMTIYQYSSKGRIAGYGSDVDINLAYLDADAWGRIATGGQKQETADKMDLFPGTDDDHDYVVKAYQTALKGRGFYGGAIDGIWGVKSMAAAEDFQRAKGIDANGIMNADTVLRLFGLEG